MVQKKTVTLFKTDSLKPAMWCLKFKFTHSSFMGEHAFDMSPELNNCTMQRPFSELYQQLHNQSQLLSSSDCLDVLHGGIVLFSPLGAVEWNEIWA